MYITKDLLKNIDLRNETSPRTNPKASSVSQALKKDKAYVSLHCSRIIQGANEKLSFSQKNF